ncbi:MAG: hypothetical protein KME21_03220 [Desmonostoc vinosum HA7617-LM4]|jgi:uncharacterized membrane protein|nr:hypothetical protein [Desmonostoc vinosum HA7617-LM4]
MKTFMSCVVLLGIGTGLLVGNVGVAETTSGEEFIAHGTEPFWSVTVSKRGIVYSSPDIQKQAFPYVTPLKAQGRPVELMRVYPLKGRSNNTLIIKKVDVCSDGMSDQEYPYSVTLILGNKVLEGCAEKQ